MCRGPTTIQAAGFEVNGTINDQFDPLDGKSQESTERIPNDVPIGDLLETPKDENENTNSTRFYFINPNGLSLGHQIENVLEQGRHIEADYYALPAIDLDTTKPWVKSRVHNHCRRMYGAGQYRAVMTNSPISYHSNKKPGGVLAVAIGDIAGRVLESGADHMGRWVYTKFSASGSKNITVICIYQPCKQNVKSAGDTTVTTQQYSLLQQAGRAQPHKVRKHYANDLINFVKECQRNEETVVVGGDFNATLGETTSGLTRLCSQCNLVDVNHERHGLDTSLFNTHQEGSKCIDYILVDPALLHSVRACGYEQFNMRFVSDHRGVYMDVDTAMFFGSNTIPTKYSTRTLNSRRIHQIEPYFQHLEKHLEDHNWYEQIEELRGCMANGQSNHQLAEKLDRRRIAGCVYAEGRLKRYPKPPYSPEIARLRSIDSILALSIRQFYKPQDDYREIMDKLLLKLGSIGMDMPPTLEVARNLRKQNLKNLRAMEKDECLYSTNRRKFQNSLIDNYDQAGVSLSAAAVKRIKSAEEMAEVWRQCAAARGLTKEGGLAYVLVPEDPDADPKTWKGNWIKIDDQKEVQEKVTARLQKHFSQSKDCNLTSPPLDVTMDFEGTCAKAEAILNGTYDLTQVDETTQWLLEHLRYVENSRDAVDWKLSSSDLEGKIKVWTEKTSTSPVTNVHLGHAKAYYALHPLDPKSKEAEELEDRRTRIINGHLTLLNYALQFGYSYDRWKVIVNALLEKDPGVPRIHRLRVIHLY